VTRVLVVEDDPDIATVLRMALVRHSFDVVEAPDGRAAMRAFHHHRPDVVLLDVGLPEIDGWEVLARIRDAGDVPVLLISAHGSEADKVRGLRSGADDYLTKPFSITEVLARVHAVLRRAPSTEALAEGYTDDGAVMLDAPAREVRLSGRVVHLTPIEFRLLSILVRNPGQVLSIDQLLNRVWDDPTGVGPDRVKYAVRRLRRKLDWDPDSGAPLQSVRGIGYRYRPVTTDS
jgi:DNA-binding response OmpR family regulator